MRAIAIGAALVLATLIVAVSGASAEGQIASTSQVVTRFSAVTGDKLRPNSKLGYPGHYIALDLGTPSISKRARYGAFTIYVVTGIDPTGDVSQLLANAHTGVVGAPGAAGIYWESGTTLTGARYWLAKKRYGANIVLTWIGGSDRQKTDPSFTRLHRALLPFASL